jgi:hypothetical protein
MKCTFIIVTAVIISLNLFGQQESEARFSKDFYKTGNIILNNNQVFNIKNIRIEEDSLSFLNKTTLLIEKMAFSNISTLNVKNGNKALTGAAFGLVIPFIFTLEALLDNEPNDENFGLMLLGIYGGGALIGAAIGAAIPVWETYHFKTIYKPRVSLKYNLQLNTSGIGAKLVLNF